MVCLPNMLLTYSSGIDQGGVYKIRSFIAKSLVIFKQNALEMYNDWQDLCLERSMEWLEW